MHHVDKCDEGNDSTISSSCIGRLNDFWDSRMLDEISSGGAVGSARRNFECLCTAARHQASKSKPYGNINIWLPPKGAPR